MKVHPLLIAAAVSAGLAGLAGCDQNEATRQAAPPPGYVPDRATAPTPTPPGDRAMAPGDSGRSVGQTLDDAGITAKVKAALIAERGVNGTSINVDTMQGRVTLSGRVPDRAQVDRAVQVANSVEGVKTVEKRLTAGG